MRIEGFGLRVEGIGLRIEGFGLRIEGFGLRIQRFGLRIEGVTWALKRVTEGISMVLANSFASSSDSSCSPICLQIRGLRDQTYTAKEAVKSIVWRQVDF